MQDIVKFALSLGNTIWKKKIHILNRTLWCWKCAESSKTPGEGKVPSVEMIYYLCRIHFGNAQAWNMGEKKKIVFLSFSFVSQFCLVTILNQRPYVRSTKGFDRGRMKVYLRNINYFNWSIIATMLLVSSTMKWISYSYTYIPPLLGLLPQPSPASQVRPSQSTELSFLRNIAGSH